MKKHNLNERFIKQLKNPSIKLKFLEKRVENFLNAQKLVIMHFLVQENQVYKHFEKIIN
jgi:hypothetical protein